MIKKNYQTLEKRVKAMKGNNIFSVVVMDICLVTDLVIPAKFKTLDFEKYKGHTCPRSHLMMYFQKMVMHTKNDKLLIHYLRDNLSRASLKWYMHGLGTEPDSELEGSS